MLSYNANLKSSEKPLQHSKVLVIPWNLWKRFQSRDQWQRVNENPNIYALMERYSWKRFHGPIFKHFWYLSELSNVEIDLLWFSWSTQKRWIKSHVIDIFSCLLGIPLRMQGDESSAFTGISSSLLEYPTQMTSRQVVAWLEQGVREWNDWEE